MRYLKDVTTLTYDNEKCVGCGKCLDVCPQEVFNIVDDKANIKDKDACIECGACAINCPTKALSVNAGVGCAIAIIHSWISGEEPT